MKINKQTLVVTIVLLIVIVVLLFNLIRLKTYNYVLLERGNDVIKLTDKLTKVNSDLNKKKDTLEYSICYNYAFSQYVLKYGIKKVHIYYEVPSAISAQMIEQFDIHCERFDSDIKKGLKESSVGKHRNK